MVECYRQSYRSSFARTKDADRVDQIEGFAYADPFKSPEIEEFWRLRQAADQIGCPYPFYLNMMFKRRENEGWRVMPRPKHMLDETCVSDVRDAWEALCKTNLQFPELPFFKAARFAGYYEQVQYINWIKKAVKARADQHLLVTRLIKEGYFTQQSVGQVFGQDVLKRALRFL